MIKDLYFIFLVYSQIWLNLLPSDDLPFLLHLPMDDCHFGFFFKCQKKKKKEKEQWYYY
jgi:hypothetical protein